MGQVLRFWVIVLSLLGSIGSVGYLLVSFYFPEAFLVATQPQIRLGMTGIAVVSIGVFTWAIASLSEPEAETIPGRGEEP